MTARCDGITVVTVYVPNGRALDADHYVYKLAWLDRLAAHIRAVAQPGDPVIVAGDFNIAPTDDDVYDPAVFVGATHVSEPERSRLAALIDGGLVDVFRHHHPDATGRVLVVGLPPRRLPRGPGDAHRPRPRLAVGGRAVAVVRDRPQRAQGLVAERPRSGRRRPRRLTALTRRAQARMPSNRRVAVSRPRLVAAASSSGDVGSAAAMASRSASVQTSTGRIIAARAVAVAPRQEPLDTTVALRRPPQQLGRRRDRRRLGRVDLGEQRARLAPVATSPPGPRDHQAIRGPCDGDVQQAHLLGPRCGGRRAAMGHRAGLHAGDDDGPPLTALGAVEREQLDAALVVGERDASSPATTAARRRRRAAARGGSRAPWQPHGHSASSRSASSSTSCAHPRSRVADGRRVAVAIAAASGEPGRESLGGRRGCRRRPSAAESRVSWLVRAGEHGDVAGAHVAGVERPHERGHEGGLVRLVVGADDAHGRAVGARRRRRTRLTRRRAARRRRRRRSAASSGGSRAAR